MLLAWSVAGAGSPPARATEGALPRVVLIGEPQDELLSRVAAELTALGFEPVFLPRAPDVAPPEGLAEAARSVDAAAAVQLLPTAGAVRIWLVDRVTGKTVLREVSSEAEGVEDPSLVVLRTVELLRASFLEIRIGSPGQGEVQAGPPVESLVALQPAAPEEEPPRLTLELAPAVAVGSFEVAPTLTVQIGGHLRFCELLGVELFALAPALPLHLAAAEGEADLHMGLLAAGVRLTFAAPEDRWVPFAGGGAAVTFVDVRSDPQPGFVERPALVAAGAPYLRGGVAVAVAHLLRVRFDVLLAWAMPATTVRFGGRDVATWGPLIVTAGLGLEVLLW
ncbi:MAG: hypothetical protein HY905_27030 [Deltaproteobacteria bacterium]|nr:hypothetical protein [Deltaproteobacteria bacterium]